MAITIVISWGRLEKQDELRESVPKLYQNELNYHLSPLILPVLSPSQSRDEWLRQHSIGGLEPCSRRHNQQQNKDIVETGAFSQGGSGEGFLITCLLNYVVIG